MSYINMNNVQRQLPDNIKIADLSITDDTISNTTGNVTIDTTGNVVINATSNLIVKSNSSNELHFGYENLYGGQGGGEWKIVNTDTNSNIHLVTTDSNGAQNNVMVADSYGRVGIGTSSPSEKLEVYPGGNNSAVIGRAHIGYILGDDFAGFGHVNCINNTDYAFLQKYNGETFINSGTGQDLYLRRGADTFLRLTQPSVGTPPTSVNTVRVDGYFSINRDPFDSNYKFSLNGAGTYNGSWNSISDDRIKYNEQIIDPINALAMINQLEPQYYEKIIEFPNGVSGNWIPSDAEWPSVKDNYVWDNEAGLIAQDIRAIPGLSFAVSGQEVDVEGTQTPLQLNYNDIYVYHIAATKELSSQLTVEKAKVTTLETQVAEEKAKTATLETQVSTLETQVADLLARVTALENP